MLKSGILDNAGKAVTRALITLGYVNVENVRIGKTIYINETTEKQIKLIAIALTNKVMENYTIEKVKEKNDSVS